MTIKVPEYHTTIEYNSDTYYIRNLWISDKTFYLECMADFPSESFGRDYLKYFEIMINRKLSHLMHKNKGYFPLDEDRESFPNAIFLKNNVPFGTMLGVYAWEEEERVLKHSEIAIHPSFRNQGLANIIAGYGQYWSYSSEAKLPISKNRYELNHGNIKGRQNAKNRNHNYVSSRPANVFGTKNTSPVIHTFYTTKDGYHDYTPGANYSVTLQEYDLTDDKYKTEHVLSGQMEADINNSILKWDRGL